MIAYRCFALTTPLRHDDNARRNAQGKETIEIKERRGTKRKYLLALLSRLAELAYV